MIFQEILNESGSDRDLIRVMSLETFDQVIRERSIPARVLNSGKNEIALFRSSSNALAQFRLRNAEANPNYPATDNYHEETNGFVFFHFNSSTVSENIRGASVKPIAEIVSQRSQELITEYGLNKNEIDTLSKLYKETQNLKDPAKKFFIRIDTDKRFSSIKEKIANQENARGTLFLRVKNYSDYSGGRKESEERIVLPRATDRIPLFGQRGTEGYNYIRISFGDAPIEAPPVMARRILNFMIQNRPLFIMDRNYDRVLQELQDITNEAR